MLHFAQAFAVYLPTYIRGNLVIGANFSPTSRNEALLCVHIEREQSKNPFVRGERGWVGGKSPGSKSHQTGARLSTFFAAAACNLWQHLSCALWTRTISISPLSLRQEQTLKKRSLVLFLVLF